MLDAAADLLLDGGVSALTAAGVARRLAAPSGSVYHRFGSRDELAAALWMRTVERFDAEVVDGLNADGDPVEVAVAVGRRVISWTRSNPVDAFVLTMFRREELAGGEVGTDLAERAATLGGRQAASIRQLADRIGRRPDEVTFAVAGIPMAAVRGPIESRKPIPAWVARRRRARRAGRTHPSRCPPPRSASGGPMTQELDATDPDVWRSARAVVRRARTSSLHCAIASIDANGSPHVTPIGSVMLGDPGQAIYLDVFNVALGRNLDRDPRCSVLAVDSTKLTWARALIDRTLRHAARRPTGRHRRPLPPIDTGGTSTIPASRAIGDAHERGPTDVGGSRAAEVPRPDDHRGPPRAHPGHDP